MLKKLLLAVSLLLPSLSLAQSSRYDNIILGPTGKPVPFATIAVCTQPANTGTQPCSPLASLGTSTSTTTGGANPFQSDANGNYHFYAPPGFYTLQYYGSGIAGQFVIPDTTVQLAPNSANTFSGNNAFTGVNTASNFNNTIVLDGIKYTQTDAGLNSAITAAGTNGTLVIPANVTVSITSDHTINFSGFTLRCETGGGFSTTSTNNFIFQGMNDGRVTGCTFTWASGGTCAATVKNTISRFTFDFNKFVGYPNSGCGSTVLVGDLTNSTSGTAINDVTFQNNQFVGFTGNGIGAQDFINRLRISNNNFVSGAIASAVEAINIFAHDNNAPMSQIVVTDNHMVNSTNGGCITIQRPSATSGNAITLVTVKGNTCGLGASNNGGGYSMVQLTGLTEIGNTFNTNGFAYGPANAVNAFEFADISDSIEVGDNAIISTQNFTGTFPVFTLSTDTNLSSNNNSFTNNSATMVYTGSGIMQCWALSDGNATTTMLRNSVVGNTCDFTGSTGKTSGIALSSNNASATVQANLITNNTLIGVNVAGDTGIVAQLSSGTMTHNLIYNNNVFNWNLPYATQLISGSAGFCAGCVDPMPAGPAGVSLSGAASTVANLPACNATTTLYEWRVVTDATAPAYNATLTGGSTVVVPVFCDGTNWRSH